MHIVGNKAKGRISKRVFPENKARQIFRKKNISYPLIRASTCTYQRVRNVRFSENLTCFVFLKQPFSDLSFCLITGVIQMNWKWTWHITLCSKKTGKRSFNTIGYFFLVSVLYVMISNHALIHYDWMEYSDKNHSHQILKYIMECLLSCKTEMNWKKVKKVLRSRRPEAAVCWYLVHRQI